MKTLTPFFVALFAVVFFAACTVNNVTEDEKLGQFFEANKVTGTFGMFDNSRGDFTIYDLTRFRKPVSPAQTFHIFSSLVALHTGKLTDDSSSVVAADSASSTLTLSQAFKNNSEAHFKSIANLLGKDTLKYWMDSVKYGNKKIGNDVAAFWMNDSLKISPDEQLGMIKRLYFKQHPFRASVQEQVKKMMVVVNNAQYQLAYQQGSIVRGNLQQAWIVGWIEENKHPYFFVLQTEGAANSDIKNASMLVLNKILKEQGFFEGKR